MVSLHDKGTLWDDKSIRDMIFVTIMVNFLIGHYIYSMFPPDIDIIPTSLAVALLYRKLHEWKFDDLTPLAIP